MSSNDSQSSILVDDPNEFDVLLGRGNNVNHRPGNIIFRKLAAEKSAEYTASAKKEHKDAIAQQLIGEIIDRGGRFLRPITAANGRGEHVAAWEIVTGEVVSTKAKQAMRDAAAAARKLQKDSSQLHFAGSMEASHLHYDPMLANAGLDRIQGLGEAHFPMGNTQLPNFHSGSSHVELAPFFQRQRMLEALATQVGFGGQNLGTVGMGSLQSAQTASVAAMLPGNLNLGNSDPVMSVPSLPNWLHPQLAQSAFADHLTAGQIQQHLPAGSPNLSQGVGQQQFPFRLESTEYQPLGHHVNVASLRKRLRSNGDVDDTHQQSVPKRRAYITSVATGPEGHASEDRKLPASAADSSDESEGSSTTVSSLLARR